MKDFIALDVETATSEKSSICQIGLTEVKDGVVLPSKSILIQPDGNLYDPYHTHHIHGISSADTCGCAGFAESWKEVESYLSGKTVISHYAAFDMRALQSCFDKYGIPYPEFDIYCSYQIARRVLGSVSGCSLSALQCRFGIDSGLHHRADNDSAGCAHVVLHLLSLQGIGIEELESTLDLSCGHFSPSGLVLPRLHSQSPSSSDKRYVPVLDTSLADSESYFYGKEVVFTGKFVHGNRRELRQKITDISGVSSPDNLRKTTDILVVGEQDYRVVGESGMSEKQRKAEEMLLRGSDIEIMSELEFYRYLSSHTIQ